MKLCRTEPAAATIMNSPTGVHRWGWSRDITHMAFCCTRVKVDNPNVTTGSALPDTGGASWRGMILPLARWRGLLRARWQRDYPGGYWHGGFLPCRPIRYLPDHQKLWRKPIWFA